MAAFWTHLPPRTCKNRKDTLLPACLEWAELGGGVSQKHQQVWAAGPGVGHRPSAGECGQDARGEGDERTGGLLGPPAHVPGVRQVTALRLSSVSLFHHSCPAPLHPKPQPSPERAQ